MSAFSAPISDRRRRRALAEPTPEMPSWVAGVCGVAAVASLLFTALLFLNL